MKVLIVEKIHRGDGLCLGGIAADGSSVRLLPPASAPSDWGADYAVGEVWEVEGTPPEPLLVPHTEDLVVGAARKVRAVPNPTPTIERFQPPASGPVEALFDGALQLAPSGALYVGERTRVPVKSALFWRPRVSLRLDAQGEESVYCCAGPDGECRLPYVGLQEPLEEIPAGTLLRVSLAPWWRPEDQPEREARCFLQLSGWFDVPAGVPVAAPSVIAPRPAATPRPAVPRAPREPIELETARQLMEKVFGYGEFRKLQPEIIRSVLAGEDCLGVMPTGAGKSLCYQIPALLLPGLTVVVSPLLSLMQDQVDQLREVGAPAVSLNSTLSSSAYSAAVRSVRSGEAKLVYMAPETLVRPEIRDMLAECQVSCLTVDEAHCISEWGHDFRPEYRRIREIRAACPDAVCLALTATATARVQNDIRTTLGITVESTYVAGFDRPNLHLEVQPRTDPVAQLLQVLAAHPEQSGIVYCSTRDQVDTMVAQLVEKGVRALPYHAGLDDATRRENQRLFQRDEVPVIVATIAFGMGINKSNVRFIAHHSLPDCLETYYQQIGRAGRDGLPSNCVLLFSRGDVGTIHHFIEQGAPNERPGRNARLQAMLRFAGATGCRRHPLLTYFDDVPPTEPCGMCDNCLAESAGRERVDVSEDARLFLNCILHTKQRFGRAHLVDVLRGSANARITKWGHERLPSYGQGKHRSADTWRLLVDRFIEQGLIEAEAEHGTLRLLEAARGVLDGGAVSVVLVEPKPAASSNRPTDYDEVLFERLRKLRKRLADDAGVPPYVIFSDRSLLDMAIHYPQTPEAFLGIHGVGERRAATYGESFLPEIREHVAEHGQRQFTVAPPVPAAPRPLTRGKRSQEVGSAFAAGSTIQELQEQGGVTRDTILGHLYTYVRTGGALDASRILAECTLREDLRDRVLALFESMGHEQLGPVFAELHGTVPYGELHLLRAYRTALAASADPAK